MKFNKFAQALLESLDQPVMEEDSWGNKRWYVKGKLHNNGAPAVLGSRGNYEAWYSHGKLHRLDGPARITNNGAYYYINGVELTKDEFDKRVEFAKEMSQKEDKMFDDDFLDGL